VPAAEIFERLGIFIVRRFFDEATCSSLRASVRSAETTSATIYDGDETRKIEVETRRTLRARVDADSVAMVSARLNALTPSVARHFKIPLDACQEPQFLIYRVGDFFARHADGGDDPDEPEGIRARKISVVIFLTGEADMSDSHSHAGGSLLFYNLLGDEQQLRDRGLSLSAEEGMLVAFRADTVHRVSPVTAGERHTIVTWFV